MRPPKRNVDAGSVPKPPSLREAATRRINRQMAALNGTVRAWQELKKAEASESDTGAAMVALRTALNALEHETEQA